MDWIWWLKSNHTFSVDFATFPSPPEILFTFIYRTTIIHTHWHCMELSRLKALCRETGFGHVVGCKYGSKEITQSGRNSTGIKCSHTTNSAQCLWKICFLVLFLWWEKRLQKSKLNFLPDRFSVCFVKERVHQYQHVLIHPSIRLAWWTRAVWSINQFSPTVV